jgi:hypothetical protein
MASCGLISDHEESRVITELRRYLIKPERMDAWREFFEEATRESLRHGIRVEYAGVDAETNTFVWLRSFDDESDRVARKAAFYGSDWWLDHESSAMDHVLAYEVTFLEATHVREGGEIARTEWPALGAPVGSTDDDPPDGWARSTGATFIPKRQAPLGRSDGQGQRNTEWEY